MNELHAFWPVVFAIISAVASTAVSIQQAKASARANEQAAQEAAVFRYQEQILAAEQAELEQERANTEAIFRNAQLETQQSLIGQDISLSELQATQAELERRDSSRVLAATNVAAFGGDPSSPSFRAFMDENERVAEADINNIRLQGNAVRLGLLAEDEQIGLQERENIIGAQFVQAGSKQGLAASGIASEAAAARDRTQLRLSSIRSNATVARSLISGATSIARASSGKKKE